MPATRTRAAAKTALTATGPTIVAPARPRRTAKRAAASSPTTVPVIAQGAPSTKGILAPSASIIVDSRASVRAKTSAPTRTKAVSGSTTKSTPAKRQKPNPPTSSPPNGTTTTSTATTAPYSPSLLPLTPTISLPDAIAHLTAFDPRFGGLFEAMPCRPFVEPYQAVDPFRTLATSIIGQQVSWMAARAINNRFRGLFGYTDEEGFPSPEEVVKKDVMVLKSAGLSLRKAEYVVSLAEHFISGQLSTELLRDGTDEEITKALIAVRGIGQWTVDMFLIFSLRRSDILPFTDLGVQKGLLRFALTAHGAFPDKDKGKFVLGAKKAAKDKERQSKDNRVVIDKVDGSGGGTLETCTTDRLTPPPSQTDAQQFPPTPHTPNDVQPRRAVLHTPNEPGSFSSKPMLPPTPYTPGTDPANGNNVEKPVEPVETLEVEEKELPPPAPEGLLEPLPDHPAWDADRIAPLTNGLSVEVLRSRWSGKKVKGGAYLTPQEMEALTEGWKPYRSLGVYYTWAIADGGTA